MNLIGVRRCLQPRFKVSISPPLARSRPRRRKRAQAPIPPHFAPKNGGGELCTFSPPVLVGMGGVVCGIVAPDGVRVWWGGLVCGMVGGSLSAAGGAGVALRRLVVVVSGVWCLVE